MSARFDTTWQLVKPHARPRLPVFALVMFLGTVSAFSQASVILLFIPIWNLVLFPDASEGGGGSSLVGDYFRDFGARMIERGVAEDPRMVVLVAMTVAAVGLSLIAGLAQWGYTWFSRRVAFEMVVDLRVRLARHLMGLSMRYHNRREFGDLLSRISADVGNVLEGVNVALRALILEPLMAVAVMAMAIAAAPIPAGLVLVALPLLLWPVTRMAKHVRTGSTKSLISLGASVQALSQMFQGIRTVKSFGCEDRELDRYRELNEGYLKSSMKMVRAIALTQAWTAFYSIAGIALLVMAVGWLTLRFDLFETGGQMGAFLLLVGRLNNHIKNATRGLTRVEESVGASERIQALLDESTEVIEREDPVRLPALGSGIRFENVTFRYEDEDEPAIRELSLEIRPGETLALVGPSGAGKSTLADLIARLIDPSAGRITVAGHDLRDVALSDWTKLHASVGQTPFLFHTTVGENIGYGRPGATQEEIEEAAQAADIHEFIAALPKGYETGVADMGSRLSGGQRQRITIARAILKGAPLLLLDEATSSLDSESEAEVQRALENLMADRTVVVIAHRLATVRDADRIVVLEDGRLVDSGTHAELIGHEGTYSRLHALQSLDTPREDELSESPAP